jgi:hypothetical protein
VGVGRPGRSIDFIFFNLRLVNCRWGAYLQLSRLGLDTSTADWIFNISATLAFNCSGRLARVPAPWMRLRRRVRA